MKKILIALALISYIACTSDDSNKVCRNFYDEEVDWYVIFFMPSSASPNNKINYGYFDPTLSDIEYYEYDETNFPPTRITRYVTKAGDDPDFNYFFWNDDKTVKDGESTSCSNSKAHAKGSLVYDENYGAFLLHSLPRYPTRTEENDILTELPSNGGSYGQTFLCISVKKKVAEKIVELLNYINISVNKSIDKDKVNITPNTWTELLIHNQMYPYYPKEYRTSIVSRNGLKFDFIGKNYKNKVIPFDTTLRSMYKDDFYVRTWTRPNLAPAITKENYKLVNVLEVKFGEFTYNETKEHSKWAISRKQNLVCLADLNHTDSQKDRGGNIVCFRNKKLNKLMKRAMVKIDKDDPTMTLSRYVSFDNRQENL